MDMLRLLRKLFFLCLFCVRVSAVGVREACAGGGPKDAAEMLNARRLAEFKRRVVNNAACDTQSELPAEGLTYKDIDDLRPGIVYVDIQACVLPCVLRLRAKPNGKMLDSRGEGLSVEIFVKRILRAVSPCPDIISVPRTLKSGGLF